MKADRFEKLRFLRELASLGEEVELRDGTVVVEEGAPADSVYFILEGQFEVIRGGKALGRMEKGAVFGEIAAVTGGSRNATVICRQTGLVLRVAAEDFVAVLHRQPELIVGMYRDLAGKVFNEGGSAAAKSQLVNFDSATVLEAFQDHRGRRNRCWDEIGVWGDRSCPELEKHLHCQNCPVFEDAGRGMLDRAATSDYLKANRAFLDAENLGEKKEIEVRVVPFRLGEEWFALPAVLFGQVVAPKRVQRIPHRTDGLLRGIVTIQGETLILFDLPRLLGLEAEPERTRGGLKQPRQAVIGEGSQRWVFEAEEFAAVTEVRQGALQTPPVTLEKAATTFTRGLIELEGRKLAVLDEELLFYQLGKECG